MGIYIYTLSHPITKEIRYVGKTNNLKKRFGNHLHTAITGRRHIQRWIKTLLDESLLPIMETVDTCNENNYKEREVYWISYYKFIGANLCNHSNGGEGAGINNKNRIGKKHSSKTILLFKNRTHSEETKEKIKNRIITFDTSGSRNGNSKRCIYIPTGQEYSCLKEACTLLKLKYNTQARAISVKSRAAKFRYIT